MHQPRTLKGKEQWIKLSSQNVTLRRVCNSIHSFFFFKQRLAVHGATVDYPVLCAALNVKAGESHCEILFCLAHVYVNVAVSLRHI